MNYFRNVDPCFIIAEIGQNHQGSLEIAKSMIKMAKQIGANCVKFQKSSLNDKFTKAALARPYITKNSWGKTYGEHKEFLEFSLDDYKILKNYSNEIGILFTASAMDPQSFVDLQDLNVPFIKIGSGDANNFPMLRYARSTKIPLVISTGMQNIKTINKIYSIMNVKNFTNFSLMHCVSSYPTNFEDIDLRFIEMYKQLYPDIVIGYSGHEQGIMASVAAVMLGAKIIERHFTLDKNQKGSDHFASLNPHEFKTMIDIIRSVETEKQIDISTDNILNILTTLSARNYLDNAEELKHIKNSLVNVSNRVIKECELPCFNKLGKSCVYSNNLSIGDIITEKDVSIKVSEPNGISAEYYDSIIGKTIKNNCYADSPINKSDFI